MTTHDGVCMVAACRTTYSADDINLVQDALTWHVYEEHRPFWEQIIGTRPPRQKKPDPALVKEGKA